MKILNIGAEPNIFKEGSEARQRIVGYGQLAEELHLINFSKKEFKNKNWKEKIGDNVFLYATNSYSKLFYVLDAVKISKKVVSGGQSDWLISAQDPLGTGLVGYLVKKRFGMPLQLQIHGDFLSLYYRNESYLNRFRYWLAKFLIPRADGIRVVSERIKRSLISKYQNIKTSKIIVLPIFVDIKKIQEAPIKTDLHQKYSQFDFIVLMASRLTKEKNIGLAVEAMQEVIKSYPKAGLIIVGDGKEKNNLKYRIENLKLNENIIMESWNDDLISYYKTADLFLLISNHEGYGRTPAEAMAAGCPVIMTDVGCAGELVKNEFNGLVIPVGSKEALIKNIERMIKEPVLRDKLKNNGLAAVKNLPTKEEYLNSYKESWSI